VGGIEGIGPMRRIEGGGNRDRRKRRRRRKGRRIASLRLRGGRNKGPKPPWGLGRVSSVAYSTFLTSDLRHSKWVDKLMEHG